jgi:mannose-6-phosphate isomerase-like protein (cupin superfamily)
MTKDNTAMTNYKEIRPWGTFENLLDTEYCKVKQIIIKPGQAPSYQYHFKRSEVWVVVKGKGELKLNDEIKQGSYFGEDDIVRLEDNYGRV